MCDFPAKRLLQRRRDVVLTALPETAIEVIRAIDEERWKHEAKTGCDCWDRAIAESPNPLQPMST